MRWLLELLEQHPELALDDAGDRERAVAILGEAIAAHLAAGRTLVAVGIKAYLKLQRRRGAIVSTSDIEKMSRDLAELVIATLEVLLLERAPAIAIAEDIAS